MKSGILHPHVFTRTERFFRQDFSSVRVIFSSEPAVISALAFACDEEIHIAPEAAALSPAELSRIMAHELAHIVQQRAGRVHGPAGSVVIDPSLESEAEACAELFAAGAPVAPILASCAAARLRKRSVIQPISRDKYLYIPAQAGAPADQALKQKYDEFQSLVNTAFTQNKNQRTFAASAAHGSMTSSLKPGGDRGANAAVLLAYEKEHLQSGGDWRVLKGVLTGLHLRPRDGVSVTEEIIQVDDSKYDSAKGTGTAEITCKLRSKEKIDVGKKKKKEITTFSPYTLGTVLFGDKRFALLDPQPQNLTNNVYVRSGGASKRQYVLLTNSGTHVKRFVVRGINHEDAWALGGRQPLVAAAQGDQASKFEVSNPAKLPEALEGKTISGRHNVTEGTALSEKQQMVSHTRGWQKRYISTGVSKRDAYSTRGEKFDGIYGAVLIDLGKVDETRVFDLHTPAAAQMLLGLNAMSVTTATNPGLDATTTEQEEFLALRDVLRTRELLIKERVPFDAVLSTDLGKCIVGIGVYERINETAMLERIGKLGTIPKWVRTDIIEYKGLQNRYWFFMRFKSEPEAETVLKALMKAREKGEWYLTLNAYGIPNNVAGR